MLNFTVKNRSKSGVRETRKLRLQGLIPGIIYGDKKEPVMISISEKELTKECSTSSFFNRVLSLNIDSQVEKVLPKEVAYHPVTGRVIHVDFMRVSKGSKIRIQIPVETINEDKAPGIKKGGIINMVVHKLECYVDPDSIPEKIELDLTGKEIGESFLLDQIQLPNGVKPVNSERDAVLATIVISNVSASEDKSQASATTAETTTTEDNK
ncbi:MAG: 50S ribosomal protein L25/general stress protein Ctc [Alphaproteobacteria bacterium]|nr:50S ribosomal protein L25/general stress protein Ctc [Alphaproteobacteria bacterium]